MADEAEKFLVYCKLTCLGGSEKGTCSCSRSKSCELLKHPRFQHYRSLAAERMARHITNAFYGDKAGPESTGSS